MTANSPQEMVKMPLHELNGEPRATLGDGKNWVSVQYRDVPQGFRIRDVTHRLTDSFVTVPTAFTAEMWATLCDAADKHFAMYEIVGDTFQDFLDRMNDAWAVNEDTFFRLMAVYNDDIANPVLGRTEIVTYGADGNPVTTTDTHTDTEERETTADHIDVPVDGSVGNPTYKDVAKSKVKSGTIVDSHTQTGVVKTEMSDLGVRPNYESLNGFLDNNRTLLKVFFGIFEGCFTLHQSMRW